MKEAEILKQFEHKIREQEDLPSEFVHLISDNFWELFE